MCGNKGGGSKQDSEPAKPTPPVKAASPATSAVKKATAQASAKKKRVASTILAGETGGAETRQKTLLGGG